MGKTKRGSKLRSWDVEEAKDKEAKFLRTCPCKVKLKAKSIFTASAHAKCGRLRSGRDGWWEMTGRSGGRNVMSSSRSGDRRWQLLISIIQLCRHISKCHLFSGVHSSDVNNNVFYLRSYLKASMTGSKTWAWVGFLTVTDIFNIFEVSTLLLNYF